MIVVMIEAPTVLANAWLAARDSQITSGPPSQSYGFLAGGHHICLESCLYLLCVLTPSDAPLNEDGKMRLKA